MANRVARSLRKNLTPQEVKVWSYLRFWRARGLHFRRQSPRKGFIVDFVCLKHCSVVGVDGGQRNLETHAARDRERDEELSRAGFRDLHFWNSDVDRNLDGVLQTIDAALREGKPHPAAFGGHPLLAGEG
jgi:very-short-patch-repair endonuclease